MGMDGEVGGRIRQMRDKAKELSEAAERSSDPQDRERLKEKARKLQSQAEQESSMGSGDIFPME
ncbi:small hydrophilic protein [Streptomyces sp. Ru73]|uniref:DUF6381 family protein n=1 Tax=Streptomyces sp. Ru73 TaxID=2080748 RepID=UPI000CDD9330|nr:DUF6381 family protein [Streptomyces sp. Ru73]POX43421.1 small hydrophilic protein [Streptomyces sp. Ru73]